MRQRGRVRSRPKTVRREGEGRRGGAPWALLFALLLAVSFIEVWESTTASELSMEIDRLRSEVQDGEARLGLLRARAAEHSSRTRLAGRAEALGLTPAEPEQLVVIPSAYLTRTAPEHRPADGWIAVGQRVTDLFVPSARARDRGGIGGDL